MSIGRFPGLHARTHQVVSMPLRGQGAISGAYPAAQVSRRRLQRQTTLLFLKITNAQQALERLETAMA